MQSQLDIEKNDRYYPGKTYVVFARMNVEVMKIIPAQLKLNSGENPTFSKSPKETSALSLLPSQVETMRLARKRSNVNEKQKM